MAAALADYTDDQLKAELANRVYPALGWFTVEQIVHELEQRRVGRGQTNVRHLGQPRIVPLQNEVRK